LEAELTRGAIERGIPRHVLEEYAGESWADAALAKGKRTEKSAQQFIKPADERSRGAILAPSARTRGKWQLTYFDVQGFSMDETFDTREAGVEAIEREGYEATDEDVLTPLSKTDAFREGNEATQVVAWHNAGIPGIWEAYQKGGVPAAKEAYEAYQKSKKQPTERTLTTEDVPATSKEWGKIETAVGPFRTRPGGKPNLVQWVKALAREVPEFAVEPMFTVDKDKMLVFQDGGRYKIHPRWFGLDTETLQTGETIWLDRESFGIKYPSFKKLSKAEKSGMTAPELSEGVPVTNIAHPREPTGRPPAAEKGQESITSAEGLRTKAAELARRLAREETGGMDIDALVKRIMVDYDELEAAQRRSESIARDEALSEAVAHLDTFFKERDAENGRIDSQTLNLRERIAAALGVKQFLPTANPEVRDVSLAMMVYIDSKQYPENTAFLGQLSDEQRRIYDLSQNLPSEIRAIADDIIALEREAGARGIEEGVLTSALDNHIAHIWDLEGRPGIHQAKFRTKTPFAKRRTLVNGGILEGWAKGYELKVEDVTQASRFSRQHINEAIAGRHLIKLASKAGIVAPRNKAGKDWVEINHPNFSVWKYAGKVEPKEGRIEVGDMVRPSDRENLGRVTDIVDETATVHFVNRAEGTEATKTFPLSKLKVIRATGGVRILDDGTVLEKVKLYAEPEMGSTLNRVFASSGVRADPLGHVALKYNAVIKQNILFTSFFHHQAFLRSYMLGGRGLNPIEGYRRGREALRNFTPELERLVANGLTVGAIQDYDRAFIHDEQTFWGRAIAMTKPGEAVRTTIIRIRDANERFLFGKLGPYLKVWAGVLEYRHELKRNAKALADGTITADEIAAAVAELTNNDFGGLHLERMYAKSRRRNANVQDIFRLLALAPDWTESNVRSMIQAARGGEVGVIHRAFWGRIMLKGMGATIAANLLLAAFDDEDFWERYKKAWEAGRLRWLDVDVTPLAKAVGDAMTTLTGSDAFQVKKGTRKYFSLIGHFRDPIKFIVHPIRSAKHKASPTGRISIDLLTGTDWAGRAFTDLGELTGVADKDTKGRLVKWEFAPGVTEPSQVPSFLLYELRSAMPIQVQNTLAFLAGEIDFFDWWTKNIGMMTATAHPKKKKR
jgi:hypothetical protein